MFEAVELGHQIEKSEFERLSLELRTRLLEAQRTARQRGVATIVIIGGVEGAGKSETVNRLREWMDPRGISVSAFLDETDEERFRPFFWRFWRVMPARGDLCVLIGAWYRDPMARRMLGVVKRGEFEAELERINSLERMLSADGALIVKFWLHISKAAQKKSLKSRGRRQSPGVAPWERKFKKRYDEFVSIAETLIRHTDSVDAPWQLIDAEDARYRDLRCGQILCAALEGRFDRAEARSSLLPSPEGGLDHGEGALSVLDRIERLAPLPVDRYEETLEAEQRRLGMLAWEARRARCSLVCAFEGWDAAGKGGVIRRLTGAIDARILRVISIAAPTDEEKAHHYLWRFWRHIPSSGGHVVFDRTWYGRVLVERVEGFASRLEWTRAYQEINQFEHQLTNHGIVLCKFWLDISEEEQLRRFHEREQTEYKRYKITDEDWRNRQKRRQYEEAIDEMVRRCSTENARWSIVDANDKRAARVKIVTAVADALEHALIARR